MSLSGILLLLLTAAVNGEIPPVITVGAGQDVTLPCENVLKSQEHCSGTTWMISGDENATAAELTNGLQIKNDPFKERLTVTATCSLVIKNITEKHVGRYSCRQYTDGNYTDSFVFLSVINMETQESNGAIILYCTVISYSECGHTVNWLHEGHDDLVETRQSACSARVDFPDPGLPGQKSNRYESLRCNVTERNTGKTLLCSAASRPLCVHTAETNTTPPGDTVPPTQPEWWHFVTVGVGLVVLIVIVIVITWKKTKGNKPQRDENTEQRMIPATETSQATLDPEDGVSYASISYVKKNNNTQVRGKSDDDGDEGETVTYTSVKMSPPPASAEHSSIYATVNKTKKMEDSA